MSKVMYLSWAALCIAIVSNVAANIFLKYAMTSIEFRSAADMFKLPLLPVFWIGVTFATLLLLSYLIAIRNLPVGSAYAIVTSLAMVGIVLVESQLFKVPLNTLKITGLMAIVAGIWMMTRGTSV